MMCFVSVICRWLDETEIEEKAGRSWAALETHAHSQLVTVGQEDANLPVHEFV